MTGTGRTCPTVWAARGLVIALTICLCSSAAGAQAPGGSAGASEPDRERLARGIFTTGRQAYLAGRYLEAVEAFERVFAMTGYPLMLVNVGNARARLGEPERAIAAYRQYLGLVPEAPERLELEHRIAELEAEVLSAAAPPVVSEPVAQQPTGLWLGRTWTWVAGAGAVVSLGIAGALWADANARYDSLASTCGSIPGGCAGNDVAGVSSAVTLTNVAMGAAMLSALGAVSLWFIEAPTEAPTEASTEASTEERQKAPRIEANPTLGGIRITGRF
ncbi:MAG: hypothetical protein OXU20_15915 [Myxococcales bacterium]|nr:hypothetical protein [Myxococcales bacterium]MDD9970230.1 hypothetical protein [Myxococcales bacterium]